MADDRLDSDIPEADRVEQQLGVVPEGDEESLGDALGDADAPFERADEGDRVEQARVVADDDEADRPEGSA